MSIGRFRFGLFEFDSVTGELRREGGLVRLQAQPAQVLRALLQHADRIVSREELHEAVWHGETFVDFERGLNFCVAQIRAALNDNAAEPRFIRTIPKRGYQFIAPVARLEEAVEQNATPETTPRRRRFIAVLAASCALALLAVAGYWLPSYWFKARAEATPVVAVVRFDNETGNPDMSRFGDAIADNLVVELATRADRHYRVIGNAHILRLPRDQRDLTAIASSLGASYLILGQVQSAGTQTRVLAHLIHLPDQTHVWVARIDHTVEDPLGLEAQIAQTIALQFSPRIRPTFTAMNSHRSASL
jgi:DNA-binding winged helix-turn-helix (wHTH) protein/TolB-like protein